MEDSQWCFDRPLGTGAFGVVASWSSRDAAGLVVDEVAVKKTTGIAPWDKTFDLAYEAVLQKQIDLGNCESTCAFTTRSRPRD